MPYFILLYCRFLGGICDGKIHYETALGPAVKRLLGWNKDSLEKRGFLRFCSNRARKALRLYLTVEPLPLLVKCVWCKTQCINAKNWCFSQFKYSFRMNAVLFFAAYLNSLQCRIQSAINIVKTSLRAWSLLKIIDPEYENSSFCRLWTMYIFLDSSSGIQVVYLFFSFMHQSIVPCMSAIMLGHSSTQWEKFLLGRQQPYAVTHSSVLALAAWLLVC